MHSPPLLVHALVSAMIGAAVSLTITSPLGADRHMPRPSRPQVIKKAGAQEQGPAQTTRLEHLATLVNLHSGEVLVLDEQQPTEERFSLFLKDRVTNSTTRMAPELIDMLRQVVREQAAARVEIVSGYRSWKLNELLRKKGRKVAEHSEHSKGQAVDFRIVGVSPEAVRKQLEAMQWNGGLGYYPKSTDQFVHVDVGRKRRWRGK